MGLDDRVVGSKCIEKLEDLLALHVRVGSIPGEFDVNFNLIMEFFEHLKDKLVAVLSFVTQYQYKLLDPGNYNVNKLDYNMWLVMVIIGNELRDQLLDSLCEIVILLRVQFN